jgi:hypothetical protein
VRQIKKQGDTGRVAEICECSLRHVQSTWKKYIVGGVGAIKTSKMGSPKGSGCKLTPEQENSIIQKRCPIQLALSLTRETKAIMTTSVSLTKKK